MGDFKLRRLGVVMEPEPENLNEVEGVLNPGAVRGPDGALYLFPRLVAKGNYSRIGIARVRFNESGDPAGVERLGIALEPATDYERRPDGSGGCEDPRVTFVAPLQRYLMTYTAWSSDLSPAKRMHYESAPLLEQKAMGNAACGGFAPAPPGFSALMPLPIGSYCEQIAKGGCRNIPPGSVEAH
jgi:hypothetical protein